MSCHNNVVLFSGVFSDTSNIPVSQIKTVFLSFFFNETKQNNCSENKHNDNNKTNLNGKERINDEALVSATSNVFYTDNKTRENKK